MWHCRMVGAGIKVFDSVVSSVNGSKGLFIFLLIAFATSGSALAGMMDADVQSAVEPHLEAARPAADAPRQHEELFADGFDIWAGGPLPVDAGRVQEEEPTQEAKPLTDGTNSLSLCLSAMAGFGLISSARRIRRMHFGFVPDWYHDGGPFQVGHSLAATPDCLCKTPAVCFIQPNSSDIKACLPQAFHLNQIVSLWRKSQYIPEATASRGPPFSF